MTRQDGADSPISDGWPALPLKRFIRSIESGVSVNAIDVPAQEGELGVLKTSCVYSGTFDPFENKRVVAEELDRVACPVRAGTLIVSRMNTPDLVGAAAAVMESTPGIYLPDRLWQVEFSGLDPRFVDYWTKTELYRSQVRVACAGSSASMQNLSQEDFTGFILRRPPQQWQRAAVRFLDRETTRIDALIEKKTRFIELLREKRRALITQAVTQGLDPSVPMKDSGVDWLGQVPAHWAIKPLKLLARFLSGGTPSKENRAFWDGAVPWASAKDLKTERLADTQDHLTEVAIKSGAAEMIAPGAVLVVVRGMILARTFPVTLTTAPMAINQDLKALIWSLSSMLAV